MQGHKLARGQITQSPVSCQEIEDCLARVLEGRAKKVTTYKPVFLLSLLHSMDEARAGGRIPLEAVFSRAAMIYWVLVVDHGLKQVDSSHDRSQVEKVLLAAFSDAGGASSLVALPEPLRVEVERQVCRAGKRYVVGAIYGDFDGWIYDFDIVDEYVRLNPAVRAFFEADTHGLTQRIIRSLAHQLARFNHASIEDLEDALQAAVGRTYLDGARTHSTGLVDNLPTGTFLRPSEEPQPPALSLRLAGLPVANVINDAGAVGALTRAGVETLGSLYGLSRDELLSIPRMGRTKFKKVWSTLSAIREGKLDPSMTYGPTMEADLHHLLNKTTCSGLPRLLEILELYYGFRGEGDFTLEEIGGRRGITRERIRQLKGQVEAEVEERLPHLRLRTLDEVRVTLGELGGLASLEEIYSLVSDKIAPGGYSSSAFARWLVERARDPMLQLLDDLNEPLVVGPPLGRRRAEEGAASVRKALESARTVDLEELTSGLAEIWPEFDRDVLRHHAELLASSLGVVIMPGYYSERRWSRADWARFVLESVGRPLHYREVAERVNQLSGEDYDEVGFNSVLNSDERFVRVGAGDFSLPDWGAKPYGRFDEVVARYLRERGTPTHERRIINDLLQIYTVSATTISAMLATGAFKHFGGGYWGLQDEHYRVDRKLEEELAEILTRTGPISAGAAHARLPDASERDVATPSLEEVKRTLYVSARFARHGTVQPQRFRCNSASSETRSDRGDDAQEESPGMGPQQLDDVIRALSW